MAARILEVPKVSIPNKVKVVMLETARGADDHVNAKIYEKGKAYEIGEPLAQIFVNEGHAECKGLFPKIKKAKESHSNKALSEKNYLNKSA